MRLQELSRIVFLLVFLFPLSAGSQQQAGPTDCKEYGFKGPVKEIITRYYKVAGSYDFPWPPDSNGLAYTRTYYLSRAGCIDSIVSVCRLSGDTHAATQVFSHANGRKSGFTSYDEKRVAVQRNVAVWKNDHEYRETGRDQNGSLIYEAVTVPDKNFRERSAGYKTMMATRSSSTRHTRMSRTKTG